MGRRATSSLEATWDVLRAIPYAAAGCFVMSRTVAILPLRWRVVKLQGGRSWQNVEMPDDVTERFGEVTGRWLPAAEVPTYFLSQYLPQ